MLRKFILKVGSDLIICMIFSLTDFMKSGAMMSLSEDKLVVGWGEFEQLTGQEINSNVPAFYFSDFFLTKSHPWLQYANWMEMKTDDFYEALNPTFDLDGCEWTVDYPERFKGTFDHLKKLLSSKILQKGVPYLFFRTSSLMDTVRLRCSLKSSLTSLRKRIGHLYGHWHESRGVLGITPESLFVLGSEGSKTVRTMALAGTCHPSESRKSFLSDPKQRHEHELVIQGISQALESLGTIEVGNIQLMELPRLIHLMTPIEIKLKGRFDFDLMVRSLHPTPALGAFPREIGCKWLLELEQNTPRGFYGAPIGLQYSLAQVCQCLVGIRNIQWDPSGMRIGVGCGVVEQSCFDNEWEEIHMKFKAVCDQFHV